MQEDSGLGKEHVTLAGPNPEHMDEYFYATSYPKVHENLKLRTDEHVILENTENDQEKTNVVDETDSIIPDLSHQTNTSAPPIINISSPTPSSQVNAPPINTKATTIILPEIIPFIALQLRVAKLEQEMSKVKKTDHSAAVLASIQSQVPIIVEKYVGTKIDAALLKALERHTADLVEKYSVLLASESSKKQESENSLKEIIRIKMEQGEKKPEPKYTIKSTDKVALEEFNLKGALFNIMHKNKSANKNPANYRLYHALMEALIEDENTMDKEVADKVKDHKRKRDSDDDEGPSAGSNQGDSTKRRRHDSSASGSAQPPSKDSEQSTKNKLESNTSAAQQPLAHTSSAWQITDIRDTPPGPLMQRTDHQSEQSSDDNLITDEGHVSDEDTDNAHIPKKNWANVYATTYQDPEENKLQRKTGDIGSFIKWFYKRTGKKKLCKANLEGPPGLVTIQPQLFFNKDLEYLLSSDKERKTSLSISKLKAARYLDFGLEELVPYLWVESERINEQHAAYIATHNYWFRRKEFYINKHREPSNREVVRSHMRILSVISIKTYERYEYNYLREIVLRRADYKEYKISEKDFKNLHPNDFEDLYLLHLHDKLNHLPKSNKVNLHTAVNMWIRNIVIKKYVEDLQLGVPRAVIYRDRDDNKKMMRIDEMHKFSDGTLMRIRDKLDFMVKDFRLFKFNKGMETRKWTENDKRRSEDFIEVIEKRLKIRRIFRSLESFVGGRLRDIDYRLINRTE
ncbi:hypothetical protein Tco_0269405 [Tanacetum coccineum]